MGSRTPNALGSEAMTDEEIEANARSADPDNPPTSEEALPERAHKARFIRGLILESGGLI